MSCQKYNNITTKCNNLEAKTRQNLAKNAHNSLKPLHSIFVSYLQLFLTVCVCFFRESQVTPWISTLTNGSRGLPVRDTGRLEPLITCWMGVQSRQSKETWRDGRGSEEDKTREKQTTKKSREDCNYPRLQGGRLICSPLTLSLSLLGLDQRQTCMYLSRHAPLATDGAALCPAHNYSPFPLLKSRFKEPHASCSPTLPTVMWHCFKLKPFACCCSGGSFVKYALKHSRTIIVFLSRWIIYC